MNYPYANGTIKALETKVLDRNKLLVLAKYDKTEFVKVLLAMNYGSEGTTLEEVIASEKQRVRTLIDSITPSKEDTNLFYLVNDAQNLKLIYKIKKYDLNRLDLIDDNGTIKKEDLIDAVINHQFNNLTKSEKELIKILDEKVEATNNPKILSAIIDNTIYNYALKKTKNHILRKYLTLKVDITNIISMMRSKNLNWDYPEYESMIIDGGIVTKDKLKTIYGLDSENRLKAIEPYYEGRLAKTLKEVESIANIEILFDRFIISEMAKYKDDPFTIGPMIYYYLLKLSEAQNIRLIYSNTNIELKNLI